MQYTVQNDLLFADIVPILNFDGICNFFIQLFAFLFHKSKKWATFIFCFEFSSKSKSKSKQTQIFFFFDKHLTKHQVSTLELRIQQEFQMNVWWELFELLGEKRKCSRNIFVY